MLIFYFMNKVPFYHGGICFKLIQPRLKESIGRFLLEKRCFTLFHLNGLLGSIYFK